jgi:hypothetical protein
MRRPYISVAGLALVAATFGVWSASAWSSTAHVASSGPSCAAHLPHREKRHPQSAAHVLVPIGATEVLLCRYYGTMPSEARSYKLAGDRLGGVPLARTLAREFDELKSVPPGVYYCPSDDGAALYAFFRYKASPEESVRVELSGCTGASNVRLKGGFNLSVSLKHRLYSLTAGVHLDA